MLDATISQKHWPGIGVQLASVNVRRAIVLFALASLLMFQDQIVFIVINMAAANDSYLGMSIHDLTVRIASRQDHAAEPYH